MLLKDGGNSFLERSFVLWNKDISSGELQNAPISHFLYRNSQKNHFRCHDYKIF